MERLCVFSGSSPGAHPDYARAAQELGCALAGAGIGLVYGVKSLWAGARLVLHRRRIWRSKKFQK